MDFIQIEFKTHAYNTYTRFFMMFTHQLIIILC